MMRQQQSDSRKKPSRLCKFLLLLVGFKLCLLGVVFAEPFISVSFLPVFSERLLPPAVEALSERAEPEAAPAMAEKAPASPVAVVQQGVAKNITAGAAFAATTESPVGDAQADDPNRAANPTLDALNRKQEELSRREQNLKAMEQELDARLVQMQNLEQRLQTMLRDAEETRNEKYRHLVDVLTNMKARQAAEVLETLDEKIAVRVLAGMRGRQAGEILTYATPVKAARLTESLARMQLPLE